MYTCFRIRAICTSRVIAGYFLSDLGTDIRPEPEPDLARTRVGSQNNTPDETVGVNNAAIPEAQTSPVYLPYKPIGDFVQILGSKFWALGGLNQQEAQLLLGDRATRKHAKDS